MSNTTSPHTSITQAVTLLVCVCSLGINIFLYVHITRHLP